MKPLAKASDMPNADKGDLCTMFEKRQYTINNYALETDKLPLFLQSGVYKIVVYVRDLTKAVTMELIILILLT